MFLVMSDQYCTCPMVVTSISGRPPSFWGEKVKDFAGSHDLNSDSRAITLSPNMFILSSGANV